MKKFIIVLISILLLILDNSVVPFLSIHGAFPSLLFTFAIIYSLINGFEDAVFIGAISGILQDIFFAGGMGINALINLALCLLAAYIGNGVFKKKKLVPIVSVFGATILKHIIIFVIFYIMGRSISIHNIILVAIYNSVVALISYRFILMFSDVDNTRDKWRFK